MSLDIDALRFALNITAGLIVILYLMSDRKGRK